MNDVERFDSEIRTRNLLLMRSKVSNFLPIPIPWRRMRDPVANISRKIRFSQEATVFSRLLYCARPDSWAVFIVGRAKGGFLTGGPGLNGKFARVNGLQMFSFARLQWEVDSSRFFDSPWIDRDLSSVVSFRPSTRQGWTMPSHSPRAKITSLLENFFPLILFNFVTPLWLFFALDAMKNIFSIKFVIWERWELLTRFTFYREYRNITCSLKLNS